MVAWGFPQRDVRHSGSCQALTQRTNEMWELAVLKLIRDRHTLKAEWWAVWRLHFWSLAVKGFKFQFAIKERNHNELNILRNPKI